MVNIAENKKQTVKKIQQLLVEYPIVALVDVENLPAKQLQSMREKLRKDVLILIAKKRLMRIAFEVIKKQKKDIDKLADHFRGMPGLIFTKMNPFKLYSAIKKNKSSAPAKAGQIAISDIKVPAGPTGFAPGPIIGELGALGIKTKVDRNKITIINDAIVCSEGNTISKNLAAMLTRLSIFPMEVGLNIVAVWEEGKVYTSKVLDIDEEQFAQDMKTAAGDAFRLACEMGYATAETIKFMITDAFNKAKALGLEARIISKDTINDLLAIAESQMHNIKSKT